MKKLQFGGILAMVALTAFACGDDDDSAAPGGAGTSGAGTAGSSGSSAGATDGGTAGSAGTSSGSAGDGTAGAGATAAIGGTGSGDGGSSVQAGAPAQAGQAGSATGGADNAGGTGGSAGEAVGGAAGQGGNDGIGGDGSTNGEFELIGLYNDGFSDFAITATTWDDLPISAYDNETNLVYWQWPANDLFNPSKFAKTVYRRASPSSFYFCTVVFGAATLADAQANTTVPNFSDPDTDGCGATENSPGFPWSLATPQ